MPLKIRIGDLRHKITIEAPTETVDTDGSVLQSWNSFLGARAAIVPYTGKEAYMTGVALAANLSHRVMMRYRSGITAKMRVVYGTRIFDIQWIENIEERNRWLVLSCLERGV